MIRFCDIFNILIGIIGLIFCFWFSWIAIGLSGGISRIPNSDLFELGCLIGSIGIAGFLYLWSGLALWRSLPSVQKSFLVLLGTAFCFSLAYCVQFGFTMLNAMLAASRHGQSVDSLEEETVMFVLIPAAVHLLILIQFVFLRRKSKMQV